MGHYAFLTPVCGSSAGQHHDGRIPDSTVDGKATSFDQLTVLPGQGLVFDETRIELGQPLKDLVVVAGEPNTTLNLGPVGTTAEYHDLKLAVQLAPDETIAAFHLLEGFVGQTGDGAGLGSSREALGALYGTGRDDPLLSAMWYDSVGLVAVFVDGVAVRLHVVHAKR